MKKSTTKYMLTVKQRKILYDRTIFKPKGIAWFMEQMVQHKLSKWERKNPCPVVVNKNYPDMFEQEFLIPWNEKREEATKHFRDFVISIYDKLLLIGRFKVNDNKFVEKPIAKIKDVDLEGHKVNLLDPIKSKLLKIVQKITNAVKIKYPSLVCTRLKSHDRAQGRIVLPTAA